MVLPTVASASVLWKGDFETGNSSQWTKEERVNTNRLMVVSDRVREGTYALRAQVEQGDRPIQASGNRNELVYVGEEYDPAKAEGAERVYAWSTLFNEDYPSANTWQVFTQWHHTGLNGSPPVEFYVIGEQMRMRVGGSTAQDLWNAPLQRGVWNDFVLHIKWSSDPNVGFVEMYHNGQLVVPRTMRATMFRGDGIYLKQGLYRNANIGQPGVVFHDGFTVATDVADVLPVGAATATSASALSAPAASAPAASATMDPATVEAEAQAMDAASMDEGAAAGAAQDAVQAMSQQDVPAVN